MPIQEPRGIQSTWMPGYLGQVSFLERLQDSLQFGAGLLEACDDGCRTTI